MSLLADKVTASRGIALRKGFSANGEVRLLHARTDGNLDCSSGKFHSSSPNSLSADLIYVGGTVSLSDEFSAIGEVRFPNARMDALECDGKFENSGAIAFGASGIEVRGEVALRAQFQGPHIGGLLDCESGKFLNPGQIAIAADSVRVDGDANFRDGFSAKGEVRIPPRALEGNWIAAMEHLTITGSVRCMLKELMCGIAL